MAWTFFTVTLKLFASAGHPLKYESGNYRTDISLARIDGAILNNLQEDRSVAAYEKLVAAKPQERYKLILSGEVVPPPDSTPGTG